MMKLVAMSEKRWKVVHRIYKDRSVWTTITLELNQNNSS